MQIKPTEFTSRYDGLEIISSNDSGLFAVQYKMQEKVKAPKVSDYVSPDWRNPNAYKVEMLLTVPAPRKVLRSLIIVKSSANCYRIGYADVNGAEQFVARTYGEIHEQLAPFWKRKV